jgi:hypothetical protein
MALLPAWHGTDWYHSLVQAVWKPSPNKLYDIPGLAFPPPSELENLIREAMLYEISHGAFPRHGSLERYLALFAQKVFEHQDQLMRFAAMYKVPPQEVSDYINEMRDTPRKYLHRLFEIDRGAER